MSPGIPFSLFSMTISRTFRLASTMQKPIQMCSLFLPWSSSVYQECPHSAAGRLGHGSRHLASWETLFVIPTNLDHITLHLGSVSVCGHTFLTKGMKFLLKSFIHHPLQYVSGSQWPGNSCSKGSTKPLSHYVLIACLLTKPHEVPEGFLSLFLLTF